VDRDAARRVDADPHLVALETHHRDHDLVVDDDLLANLPRQD